MEQFQTKDSSLVRKVKKFHAHRVRRWKDAGAEGLKPKQYETVEDLIKAGFRDPEIIKELREQDSAVGMTTQGQLVPESLSNRGKKVHG